MNSTDSQQNTYDKLQLFRREAWLTWLNVSYKHTLTPAQAADAFLSLAEKAATIFSDAAPLHSKINAATNFALNNLEHSNEPISQQPDNHDALHAGQELARALRYADPVSESQQFVAGCHIHAAHFRALASLEQDIASMQQTPSRNTAVLSAVVAEMHNAFYNSRTIQDELAISAMSIAQYADNLSTQLQLGPVGSWFYHRSASKDKDGKVTSPPLVNIELSKALLLGLPQARFLLMHETGHAMDSDEWLPDEFIHMNERAMDIRQRASNPKTPITLEEYKELQRLEVTLRYMHNFFNAFEDNCVNEFAVLACEIDTISQSLRLREPAKRIETVIRPSPEDLAELPEDNSQTTPVPSDVLDKQRQLTILCNQVNMAFFARIGMPPFSPDNPFSNDAWQKAFGTPPPDADIIEATEYAANSSSVHQNDLRWRVLDTVAFSNGVRERTAQRVRVGWELYKKTAKPLVDYIAQHLPEPQMDGRGGLPSTQPPIYVVNPNPLPSHDPNGTNHGSRQPNDDNQSKGDTKNNDKGSSKDGMLRDGSVSAQQLKELIEQYQRDASKERRRQDPSPNPDQYANSHGEQNENSQNINPNDNNNIERGKSIGDIISDYKKRIGDAATLERMHQRDADNAINAINSAAGGTWGLDKIPIGDLSRYEETKMALSGLIAAAGRHIARLCESRLDRLKSDLSTLSEENEGLGADRYRRRILGRLISRGSIIDDDSKRIFVDSVYIPSPMRPRIVVLIDGSGSMSDRNGNGTLYARAIQTAFIFMEGVEAARRRLEQDNPVVDFHAIVWGSTNPAVIASPDISQKEAAGRMAYEIAHTEGHGTGTELVPGIAKALVCLIDRESHVSDQQYGTTHFIILGDGGAFDSAECVRAFRVLAQTGRASIDYIDIGNDPSMHFACKNSGCVKYHACEPDKMATTTMAVLTSLAGNNIYPSRPPGDILRSMSSCLNALTHSSEVSRLTSLPMPSLQTNNRPHDITMACR